MRNLPDKICASLVLVTAGATAHAGRWLLAAVSFLVGLWVLWDIERNC